MEAPEPTGSISTARRREIVAQESFRNSFKYRYPRTFFKYGEVWHGLARLDSE
jgi:hypothetical protein